VAAAPAVSGDAVVIGSKDGQLYTLELATGKLRWKIRAGEAITGPAVFGASTIYLQSWGLQALAADTGKTVWRAGLGMGVQNAPVIAGGSIYLASLDGEVYALE
jgi:outer membrane protein assembly factor BamB